MTTKKKTPMPTEGNGRLDGVEKAEIIAIRAPNMQRAAFLIRGTSPYVMNAFGQKAKDAIRAAQAAGEAGKNTTKKRGPKDFDAAYAGAFHRERNEGWIGISASAFRNACISACRVAGFAMTRAKLTIFIEEDGYDELGTPLVRLHGDYERTELPVRLDNGSMDIHPRPMWQAGWTVNLRVRWDADQFTLQDVANLIARAGEQCGVGEGRADSKNSAGMGWGFFCLEQPKEDE